MMWHQFLFQWRVFLRQPSFHASALVCLVTGFLATTLNQLSMGGASLWKNGPYVITLVMVIVGLLALVPAVVFIAQAATRDISSEMAEILYCKPIKPLPYHLGNFLGAFSVLAVTVALVPLGLWLGASMPWVDPSRLGPFRLAPYVQAFSLFSLPTLFTLACFFHVAAVRFQSSMAVYISALVLFMGYEIGSGFVETQHLDSTAALLDPFGLATFQEATRYWTLFEKNHQAVPLAGLTLANRALWFLLSLAMLVVFGRLTQPLRLRQPRVKSKATPSAEPPMEAAVRPPQVKARTEAGFTAFRGLVRFEFKRITANPAFRIIGAITLFFLAIMMLEPRGSFGTDIWPLTQVVVGIIQQSLTFFMLILIGFFSAEVAWREREHGMADLIDSMPVSRFSLLLAKWVAVGFVVISVAGASMMLGLAFQAFSGYFHFEIEQYLTRLLFFSVLPWLMYTVLALFLQALCANKYAGMLAFALILISDLAMESIGLGHHLLRFAKAPSFTYSDMNGYGTGLSRHLWYMLYWGGLSVALSVPAYLWWPRGVSRAWKNRLRGFAGDLNLPGKITLAGGLAMWAFAGSVIFYNTCILNEYLTAHQKNARMAAYEKRFGAHLGDPVPIMTAIENDIDFYPSERKIEAKAAFTVTNRADTPIERFLVLPPEFAIHWHMELEGGALQTESAEFGTRWFHFDPPLQPGERREGRFEVVRQQRGFKEADEDVQVVENGSFINHEELYPRFGYRSYLQLVGRQDRRRFDLPPAPRRPKLDDEVHLHKSFMGPGVGFVQFEATLSTDSDQRAIAPGHLEREWTENGRRFFHYRAEKPIIHFFTFLSGRLTRAADEHNGVSIEVFHHPTHGMNTDRMITSIKDSLDYFTTQFGPYPHRDIRIVEYPNYRGFAQSFATTIPYSEHGFLNDLRDPDDIDPAYKTTAHEMAHQWWGNMIAPANVQGCGVLAESLSQYSALAVMERRYGTPKLRRFLKYELDNYLRGRTREVVEEMPLMTSEDQNYIHYQKGSVVMMYLRDMLGEARMNAALATFLERHAYRTDPFPTTADLLTCLLEVTPEEKRPMLEASFQQIILYDLQVLEAETEALPDGRFQVDLTVYANRFSADGSGRETPIALVEDIDIGLFLEDPAEIEDQEKVLYLEKHRLQQGENHIRLVVPRQPSHAGVDPFITLIDRDSEDNLVRF
ncbi:ABC transporter permease [Sulfidibacter corallicola]|uniref:ABC transporter permease n=1 Tax=Sulfidibacter corallicola TaxID=2818388 RepID=A0A8A4TPZ7_SULCO|nr:M1 family aminopeptidase [Sulfidibacter corallicola]QTD51623.1 ABC transporter permease [Sulfidibacter corallicola]